MPPVKPVKPVKPVTVRTLDELAYAFDRRRPTIKEWRAKGLPGVPGKYDIRDCYRWVRDNVGSSGRADDGDTSRKEAERRKAWADAEKAEIDVAVKRGALVLLGDVKRSCAHISTHSRALLEQLPDRLLDLLPADATGEDKRLFRESAAKAVADVIATLCDEMTRIATEGLPGDDDS